MALIVVVEDDAGTLQLIAALLKREGHKVLLAEDGAQGLRLIENFPPDLVISDVQMPAMDGFALVETMRTKPAISATPVILLTSLQEREHVRQGMTRGADDYITKPFRAAELRDAVNAQLQRHARRVQQQTQAVQTAVDTALAEQKDNLAQLYEDRLAQEIGERWPDAEAAPGDERIAMATVLFVDILSAELTERLSALEIADIVKRVYGNAGDTVHLFGAHHVQMIGEGMLSVFSDDEDTFSVTHGIRAVRAAIGLQESVGRTRQYLLSRYADRQLPQLEFSVALHSGAVNIVRMRDPLHGGTALVLPVGDTVSVTLLLQKELRKMGWAVGASAAVLGSLTAGLQTGRVSRVQLPGRNQPVEMVELLALLPSPETNA